MSTEQLPAAAAAEGAPYVQLFQKAHQKIVLLDRLEEQIVGMLAKREELQDELKAVQSQINEELEARVSAGIDSPQRVLSAIAGSVTGRSREDRFVG